jgi:putative transposase
MISIPLFFSLWWFAKMTRLARMVVAGLPHHVTQRGNRREAIFFEAGDHDIYRDLLAEQTRKAGVEVWAYCLMPNHVHLILTPTRADGLGAAVGEAHRRYTNFINARVKDLKDLWSVPGLELCSKC